MIIKSSCGAAIRASDERDEYQPAGHVVSADAVTWPAHSVSRHVLDRK